MKTFKDIFSGNKLLPAIILLGILLRIYFMSGHVFSDDAYYSYLSFSLVNGNFAEDYPGYPVFPLRTGQIFFTSFSFILFGTNESATIVFPFLISILNIILTYKLASLLLKKKTAALISAFLISLFPTDITFASINFPDLINVFLINLGIYFLLKSHFQNNRMIALAGGLSFFLSMQFKENIYYISFLLVVLLVYLFIKQNRFISQIVIGLFFIAINFLLEGFIYLLMHNDFFYRITITNLNYNYSFYDFFPYTAQRLSGSKNVIRNLFDQIFLINGRAIFLRRYYLFLPIVAVIQSLISYRKRESLLLVFWFAGLALLLTAFTTSFTEFKPLDLKRSWYIYPLLMPVIILSAQFVCSFTKTVKLVLLTIYTAGSLIMCHHYEVFFDKENLVNLKSFLRENKARNIYTDHFTKYSVDLIRNYEMKKSVRIQGKDFNFDEIEKGELILYNKKHIEELEMQKYTFPDFSQLQTDEFRVAAEFNDFVFYEKINKQD